MKLLKIKFLVLAAILLIGSTELSAQWNFTFSSMQEFNSNPFRNPVEQSDVMSSFNAGIQNYYGAAKLLYYGSYSSFAEMNERDSYWHQFGTFVEDSQYVYGIYGEQRINKSDFSFFDYYEFAGYYKKMIDVGYLSPILNLSTAFRHYKELSDYDNLFLSGGFNLSKSFQTKTTLIVNGGLNYKYYTNTMSFGLTIYQVYSNLRVAQSLFENSGLAVYYTNRTMLNYGGTGNALYNSYYGDESDLYDDPVSRNENSVGVELTQLLPAGIVLKAGYEYSSRKYPSQGIYLNETDYLSGTDRSDSGNLLNLSAVKSFSLTDDNLYNLKVGLRVIYNDRASNSYWYDYQSTGVSLNLNLEF